MSDDAEDEVFNGITVISKKMMAKMRRERRRQLRKAEVREPSWAELESERRHKELCAAFDEDCERLRKQGIDIRIYG